MSTPLGAGETLRARRRAKLADGSDARARSAGAGGIERVSDAAGECPGTAAATARDVNIRVGDFMVWDPYDDNYASARQRIVKPTSTQTRSTGPR